MIITINKRLKFIPTMRLREDIAVEQRVMSLHREGWQPANIASIANINIGVARKYASDEDLRELGFDGSDGQASGSA